MTLKPASKHHKSVLWVFLLALLIVGLVLGRHHLLYFLKISTDNTQKELVPKLHILSFATHPHKPMHRLLLSSSPYRIETLGKYLKWRGYRHKLEAVRDYLDEQGLSQSDTDVVMFLDGYDTAFSKGQQDLMKKFKHFHKPIVISAETNCYPSSISECQVIATNTHQDLYPPSPTPFRYVNSGTYIGYASSIAQMLNEVLSTYPDQKDDQDLLHRFFLKHPQTVALDYHQEIFALLYRTSFSDYHEDPETQTITNLLTNSRPIVFHANGDSIPLLCQLLQKPMNDKRSYCIP